MSEDTFSFLLACLYVGIFAYIVWMLTVGTVQ